MKKIYSALLLLFFTAGIAQIPIGYYTNASGTGYTLKTQLYNIIKGHNDNGYAGLYTIYQTSDRDYYFENDATILDMYSENPTGTDPYNYSAGTSQRCGTYSVEGDCYNREHIIPQSVFNEQSPMVSDAHFITPTDGKVNGQRSNYPHGTVASPTWTSLNGSKLGASTIAGYSGTIFEPINEFKGDIARMYFYFATRYENTVAGYSYSMFNGTSNQVFSTAFLNLLLTWHNQDPVSTREIARNNAIYTSQNNRNPYIDHPEYVQAIWNPTADAQVPSAPTNLLATGTTSSSVSLSWIASSDNVGVTGYDVYMNSVLKTTVPGTTTDITGLIASTTYSFNIVAKDAAGNSSASSTVVNATTAAGTSITYCTSQGNSTADEKIGKVIFGAINNTTTGTAGYENFTVLSTNVTSGTANTITITPSWTSTVYSEGYAVWIDYNKNGAFTDAGELVWSKTTSTTTPVSGTINIPTSAALGITRMRVSMKYNSIPTSCEAIPYGQVEDYTLNIVAGTADTTAPSAPTALTASGTTQTTTNLSWTPSTDDVDVTGYEVYRGTALLGTVSTSTYNATGLIAATAYSFSVKAKDAAGNISAASNTLNVTTSATGGSTATDLLFSEYIEGSSNNKALEISNATGSAINLSVYSIKKQTNGAGSWSTGLNLTGTLNNGTKFTIVNSLIASSCYPISSANLSTSATEMAFNGNDAVGLFKNGVLLDIIGTFNGGTANFAADETIRRKATVTAPTTTFNKTTQWDSYTSDTCNNLGSRLIQKSIKEEINLDLGDITLYPNPTNGNFSINNSNKMYSIEIYSIIGQKVFEEKNRTKSEISVPHIPNGIYMVRVMIDSNSVLKKLIIN
ncbi:endonuclease [Flavobacterium sp. XS2P39]|uniref:endonuclease n=1 Tax=Flavobacterium sp. XS2P39 TaxID=3401725 RepID=UPI003AAD871A